MAWDKTEKTDTKCDALPIALDVERRLSKKFKKD